MLIRLTSEVRDFALTNLQHIVIKRREGVLLSQLLEEQLSLPTISVSTQHPGQTCVWLPRQDNMTCLNKENFFFYIIYF